MSWEVRSMKSGTSFFNRSYSLHLLRRFWPLWCLWLAVLILIGPLNLGTILPANFDSTASYVNSLNREILDSGRALSYIAIFAGPLMAMAIRGPAKMAMYESARPESRISRLRELT